MRNRVTIVLLAVVLLGSVLSLLLYNIGGYVLNSAFEIVNLEGAEQSAPSAAAPTEEGSSDTTGGAETEEDGNSEAEGADSAWTLPRTGTEQQETGGQAAQPEETQQEPAEENVSIHQAAPSEDSSGANLGYSTEEMTEIEDSISATDKLSASVLVLSKLSAEDIQYLYGLLEGGLTPNEKREAKSLCYSRFSEEEIAQIYELYTKYTVK